MKHTLKWVIHPNRYKKIGMAVGARQPVKASDYFRYLSEISKFSADKTKKN